MIAVCLDAKILLHSSYAYPIISLSSISGSGADNLSCLMIVTVIPTYEAVLLSNFFSCGAQSGVNTVVMMMIRGEISIIRIAMHD